MDNLPTFMTIRETAKTGIISEYHLRMMEKQGKLPGIRVGNRFKVNVGLLVDQLNREKGKCSAKDARQRMIDRMGKSAQQPLTPGRAYELFMAGSGAEEARQRMLDRRRR